VRARATFHLGANRTIHRIVGEANLGHIIPAHFAQIPISPVPRRFERNPLSMLRGAESTPTTQSRWPCFNG
jgi:hypothetical protein